MRSAPASVTPPPATEAAGTTARGPHGPVDAKTVLSLVAAIPALPAAAALSAGSLAAFTPPRGAARLLIAADRDGARQAP